jgi:hypothetical protein
VLCPDCEVLANIDDGARSEAPPEQAVSDQLCTRCGHLLGPENTEKNVNRKESQLERFGLSGPRRSLTNPKGKKR